MVIRGKWGSGQSSYDGSQDESHDRILDDSAYRGDQGNHRNRGNSMEHDAHVEGGVDGAESMEDMDDEAMAEALEAALSLSPDDIEDLPNARLIDTLVMLHRYTTNRPMAHCRRELSVACNIADELVNRVAEGDLMVGDSDGFDEVFPESISSSIPDTFDDLMDLLAEDKDDDSVDEGTVDNRLVGSDNDVGENWWEMPEEDVLQQARHKYQSSRKYDSRSPVRALAHSFLEEYVSLRSMSENREIQEETADMMIEDGSSLEEEIDLEKGDGLSVYQDDPVKYRESLIRQIAEDARQDAETMYAVAEFLLMYDNMGGMMRE